MQSLREIVRANRKPRKSRSPMRWLQIKLHCHTKAGLYVLTKTGNGWRFDCHVISERYQSQVFKKLKEARDAALLYASEHGHLENSR